LAPDASQKEIDEQGALGVELKEKPYEFVEAGAKIDQRNN
jgi:hypothetical protein